MDDKQIEVLKAELEDKIAVACGKVAGAVGDLNDQIKRLTTEHQEEMRAMKDRIAAAEECCHRAERIAKGIK